MQTPGRLDFTPDQIEALLGRIANQCLEAEDYPFTRRFDKGNRMDELLIARKGAYDQETAKNFRNQNGDGKETV